MRVNINRLYSPPWKLEETKQDILEGRLSQTEGPLQVSYVPEMNCYRVIDGHHRLLEAFATQKVPTVEVVRNIDIPTTYVLDMGEVNAGQWAKDNNVKKDLLQSGALFEKYPHVAPKGRGKSAELSLG